MVEGFGELVVRARWERQRVLESEIESEGERDL